MTPRICQSKRKDGNKCNANAQGADYFCYVHQNSKDPITPDPLIEAGRELFNSIAKLIEYRRRTGSDISSLFGNHTPPPENPVP